MLIGRSWGFSYADKWRGHMGNTTILKNYIYHIIVIGTLYDLSPSRHQNLTSNIDFWCVKLNKYNQVSMACLAQGTWFFTVSAIDGRWWKMMANWCSAHLSTSQRWDKVTISSLLRSDTQSEGRLAVLGWLQRVPTVPTLGAHLFTWKKYCLLLANSSLYLPVHGHHFAVKKMMLEEDELCEFRLNNAFIWQSPYYAIPTLTILRLITNLRKLDSKWTEHIFQNGV